MGNVSRREEEAMEDESKDGVRSTEYSIVAPKEAETGDMAKHDRRFVERPVFLCFDLYRESEHAVRR